MQCYVYLFKILGTSTLYKILNECSALVRKSVEGLDNFVMEGGRGFDDLENMIKQLDLPASDIKNLTADLHEVKSFLKTELKV